MQASPNSTMNVCVVRVYSHRRTRCAAWNMGSRRTAYFRTVLLFRVVRELKVQTQRAQKLAKANMRKSRVAIAVVFMLSVSAFAQAGGAANPDSSTFDPDGTAHITRVVPMPNTVSPEAQQWVKEIESESPKAKDLAEIRLRTDEWRMSGARKTRPKRGSCIRKHSGDRDCRSSC